MLSIKKRKTSLGLSWLIVFLALSSCTQNTATVEMNDSGDASMKFAIPGFLNTRAINRDNLDLFVSINATDDNTGEVAMTRVGDIWTGSTTVAENDSAVLFVQWTERLVEGSPVDEPLLLARASARLDNVTTGVIFELLESSYTTTGAEFDFDSDGVSNLEERERDLDPFNAELVEIAGEREDVQIFQTGFTTEIDGRINPSGTDPFWTFATYEDVDGQKLSINNMIRDDNAALADESNPDYQWTALHDGTYLTLFVYGKAPDAQRRISGDAQAPQTYHHDDSLEIYLDPNLSRLSDVYDKVDDLLINIPLSRGVWPDIKENDSDYDDMRIALGASVQNEVMFDVQDPAVVKFSTCFCGGTERSTWEVRINLAAAKIPIGKTFGFEIQLNVDDNGGERDAKWAWALPAREPGQTNNEVDITWRSPNRMGTAKLFPAPPDR